MILGRAERMYVSAGAQTVRPRRCCIGLIAALALAWCHDAFAAENRVILLRGYLGLFSNGLDELADELKAKGFDVEVRRHLYWTDIVNDILRDRAAGKISTLTFVGHSQGGNDAIEIATALQVSHVPVDLIVALAPVYPKPVPANVARAIDYYQAGGWGSPLTPAQGFRGSLANNNVAADQSISHFNIAENPRIRAEVLREIEAVPQAESARAQRPQPPPGRKPPAAR
jgi:pimeloyl-ACP methyl ester carboxylesterase